MHLGNTDSAAQSLRDKSGFDGAGEVLLPYLDSLYKETIDTSDQTIFTDLTQAMEKLFNDDMVWVRSVKIVWSLVSMVSL